MARSVSLSLLPHTQVYCASEVLHLYFPFSYLPDNLLDLDHAFALQQNLVAVGLFTLLVRALLVPNAASSPVPSSSRFHRGSSLVRFDCGVAVMASL